MSSAGGLALSVGLLPRHLGALDSGSVSPTFPDNLGGNREFPGGGVEQSGWALSVGGLA